MLADRRLVNLAVFRASPIILFILGRIFKICFYVGATIKVCLAALFSICFVRQGWILVLLDKLKQPKNIKNISELFCCLFFACGEDASSVVKQFSGKGSD